ncbi:MAG: ATP-dependent RNA helicase RhlB [Kangiellaceae bacterium]|nr:ATP-dependent RNA helicase RhlB [Kangiellaceae bacterium]
MFKPIKKLFSKSSSSNATTNKPTSKSVPSQEKHATADGARNPDNARSKGNKSRRHNHEKKKPPQKPAVEKWSLDKFAVAEEPDKKRFHDFDLPLDVMHAVADLNFQYCTPIQAQILASTLAGHDAIGQAQTGTGKTAAFLITVLNHLLTHPYEGERYLAAPRALILAPTRELAVQIANDAKALTKYTNLNSVVLMGGMDYHKQKMQLENSVVDICIATPGRLIDFLQSGHIDFEDVDILVLDEADRMLDMGFIPQVKRIVRSTPHTDYRQTLLFSATFNLDVMNLAQRWTHNPVRVEIEPEQVTSKQIEQKVFMVSDSDKLSVINRILKHPDVERVIIFANRRDQVRNLTNALQKRGVKAWQLSGDVDQKKRMRTLERFTKGEFEVLVATDVAARGLHIPKVSHVINYSLPEDPEDYVHRIGRTGRAGAKGVSISLVGEDDGFCVPNLETLLGEKLTYTHPDDDPLLQN